MPGAASAAAHPIPLLETLGIALFQAWERGLFYGSRSRLGCLLEGAYDELVFQAGPKRPFPRSAAMRKTLFHVNVGTELGLQPQAVADAAAQAVLRDPLHDGPTQRLGTWMREEGIEAFETLSARTSELLVQVGVFTPAALVSTPFDRVEITGEVNGDHASFLSHDDGTVHRFPRELFLLEGELGQCEGPCRVRASLLPLSGARTG